VEGYQTGLWIKRRDYHDSRWFLEVDILLESWIKRRDVRGRGMDSIDCCGALLKVHFSVCHLCKITGENRYLRICQLFAL